MSPFGDKHAFLVTKRVFGDIKIYFKIYFKILYFFEAARLRDEIIELKKIVDKKLNSR